MFAHGPGDDVFVFLPLSLLQQRYWVYSAFAFGHDVTISTYEAAYAVLRRSRPTVVMGVPAFYETARRHIETRAARDEGQDSEAALRAAAQNLFGGRIRYLWTGSAPAAPSLLEFFGRCALPIFEGYGLNETCIVSKNHPGAHRQGSVGQVLPGKRVEIDDDGVLLIHSDHPVAEHYTYAEPSASERVFRPGGVVRTGDLGYLDEDGFLFVRGRADDMLVLGNGRKIDVRPGEESLRAHPAVHECVLYCPDQTDLVAVISPAEGAGADAVASALAAANARLRPDEQIARVVLARQAFTVENELLTSQFKPRRPQIYNQYRTEIHDRREGIHAIR
jgi:long-subunit acyl-CoA synthetase (AMP-forming)